MLWDALVATLVVVQQRVEVVGAKHLLQVRVVGYHVPFGALDAFSRRVRSKERVRVAERRRDVGRERVEELVPRGRGRRVPGEARALVLKMPPMA